MDLSEPPRLPEYVVHPKNMSKTNGFKDFTPKPVARVMPWESEVGDAVVNIEVGEVDGDEVESSDPKASNAQECADSSDDDSSDSSKTEEPVSATPPPRPPSSIPSLPSTTSASVVKEATPPAS